MMLLKNTLATRWRLPLITALAGGISLFLATGCKPRTQNTITWIQADQTIEVHQENYPDRPLLFFFTARWDVTGKVLETRLAKPHFKKMLASTDLRFFVYDCTERGGVARAEMIRLGGQAYPNSLVLVRPNQPNMFYRPGGRTDLGLEKVILEITELSRE